MGMNLQNIHKVKSVVLLRGESGVGKTFYASKIHQNWYGSSRNFLEVNLAGLNTETANSELFGHKKGSFTGAEKNHSGYFETVGEGTLFLDEIGDCSHEIQKKLLKVIDQKIFIPVGSNQAIKFKGKLIVATHVDLEQKVKEGSFRADLFHRLQVFSFPIRPLRDRRVEIDSFIHLFMKQACFRYKVPLKIFSPAAKNILENHNYPGNLRELKNLCEYFACFGTHEIEPGDFPHWFKPQVELKTYPSSQHPSVPIEYHKAIEQFEREFFNKMLRRLGGRINYSAEVMKISKATLIAKAKKYGINTMEIKAKTREQIPHEF